MPDGGVQPGMGVGSVDGSSRVATRWATASPREAAPRTLTPRTLAASRVLAAGTMTSLTSVPRTAAARASVPGTGRRRRRAPARR